MYVLYHTYICIYTFQSKNYVYTYNYIVFIPIISSYPFAYHYNASTPLRERRKKLYVYKWYNVRNIYFAIWSHRATRLKHSWALQDTQKQTQKTHRKRKLTLAPPAIRHDHP